jgi:hypothetical protein
MLLLSSHVLMYNLLFKILVFKNDKLLFCVGVKLRASIWGKAWGCFRKKYVKSSIWS